MKLPVASHILDRFSHFHQSGWEWREMSRVSKVEFKPIFGVGIKPLAECRTGRDMKKTQCTFKEIITPEIFYALKVVFAKCEQTQKAFEDVTVIDAGVD